MKETSIELLESLTQADGIPGYEARSAGCFSECCLRCWSNRDETNWGASFVRALEVLNTHELYSIHI